MNQTELKVEMLRHQDKLADLADFLNISVQTLSGKMNNKSEFTQSQIMSIKDKYQLSADRVTEIFFAK